MNSQFNIFRLGEVADIIAGGDKPKVFSEIKSELTSIPVFANAEGKNGLQGYTDTPRIIEYAVTIAARGSNVGFVALRKEPYFPIVRLISLIPSREKLDVDYLFYNLKQNRQSGTGSGQPQITVPDISNRTISLPSLIEQQKAAKILVDLDSKIELNNKMNAELEGMAKLIYDYWFVQFDFPISKAQAAAMGKPELEGKPYKASGGPMVYNTQLKREIPEGWGVFNLGDLGDFKNGVNYDPSNPGEIACPIINVRNISASSYFLKNEDLDIVYLRESDVKKYSVHEGSIIIARSGIPGATRLISDFEENTLYCGFAIHFELEDLNQKLPVFFYLKSIEQLIKNGSGGTILKNVNQATLNALQVALPNNEKIIDAFNEIISPQFEKINVIQKEIQKLSELRDWLLPMLMNGQVSIKEAEEYADSYRESMAAEERGHYGK
ncbi:restriction endonuclease subunit S [Roseivirga pacifica]|uniref:restriction endonuclease subunit S n=1 Tax=Roseivirga pacifica TaxID=1267423 RepID=UPI003BA9313D